MLGASYLIPYIFEHFQPHKVLTVDQMLRFENGFSQLVEGCKLCFNRHLHHQPAAHWRFAYKSLVLKKSDSNQCLYGRAVWKTGIHAKYVILLKYRNYYYYYYYYYYYKMGIGFREQYVESAHGRVTGKWNLKRILATCYCPVCLLATDRSKAVIFGIILTLC